MEETVSCIIVAMTHQMQQHQDKTLEVMQSGQRDIVIKLNEINMENRRKLWQPSTKTCMFWWRLWRLAHDGSTTSWSDCPGPALYQVFLGRMWIGRKTGNPSAVKKGASTVKTTSRSSLSRNSVLKRNWALLDTSDISIGFPEIYVNGLHIWVELILLWRPHKSM